MLLTSVAALGLTFTVLCRFQVLEQVTRWTVLEYAEGTLSASAVAALCVFAAMAALVRTAWGRRLDSWAVGLGTLLAVLYTVSMSFRLYDGMNFFRGAALQRLLALCVLAGYAALFTLLLQLLFRRADRLAEETKLVKNPIGGGRWFLLSAAAIGASWLAWTLMNYPGTLCPDSQSQLRQFWGQLPYNGNHPTLSTLVMGGLFAVGKAVWNADFGVWLYLLLCTAAGAVIFSVGLDRLRRRGLPLSWCAAGTAFFALTPLWGSFAQWYEKDLLFAEAVTLFFLFLAEVLWKGECGRGDAVGLALSALLASLLRNGCVYGVVPAVLALLPAVKGSRRRLLAGFLGILAAYLLIGVVLLPRAFQVQRGSTGEFLSIPMQQTARCLRQYEGAITREEWEAIDSAFEAEGMAALYDPDVSDPVKDLWRGEEADLGRYMRTWAAMGLKYPGVYAAAFLNGASGYLAPTEARVEAMIGNGYHEFYAPAEEAGISRPDGRWTTELSAALRDLSQSLPVLQFLAMPGTYTWVVLVAAVMLLRRRKFSAMALLVPAGVVVLLCMASPLSNTMRYILPAAAMAPFILGWTRLHLARARGGKKGTVEAENI